MLLDLEYVGYDVRNVGCWMRLCGNGTLDIGMFGTGGDRHVDIVHVQWHLNDEEPVRFVEVVGFYFLHRTT